MNKFVKVNTLIGEFLGYTKSLEGPMIVLENTVRLTPTGKPGEVMFRALSKDKAVSSSTVRIGAASAVVFELATTGSMFDAYEQETSNIIMARPRIAAVGMN